MRDEFEQLSPQYIQGISGGMGSVQKDIEMLKRKGELRWIPPAQQMWSQLEFQKKNDHHADEKQQIRFRLRC